MAAPCAAQLDGVSRLFGDFAALRNVSFAFETGKAYLVRGENGAGKSTLLRIVAGLSHPSRGKAHLPLKNSTAYMAHDAMLYDEMTAAENLNYFAALYAKGACLPASQALEAVGLGSVPRDRPVGKFSAGMRQRASLARAILSQPKLLLLDEPFSNLDRTGVLAILELLRTLRERGTTILFTTHQHELAQDFADATLMLHRGQLAAA